MALTPPCPLSDFFGSLAENAGAGGHPADDKNPALQPSPGLPGVLKAAGRNGRT